MNLEVGSACAGSKLLRLDRRRAVTVYRAQPKESSHNDSLRGVTRRASTRYARLWAQTIENERKCEIPPKASERGRHQQVQQQLPLKSGTRIDLRIRIHLHGRVSTFGCRTSPCYAIGRPRLQFGAPLWAAEGVSLGMGGDPRRVRDERRVMNPAHELHKRASRISASLGKSVQESEQGRPMMLMCVSRPCGKGEGGSMSIRMPQKFKHTCSCVSLRRLLECVAGKISARD